MKVLDLGCKAGGISMGWHQAGFEVEGVDIEPQPNYPFKFYRADMMTFPLEDYDVIVASPPCQAYSSLRHAHGYEYPDLISALRGRLVASGKVYVIENVVGAPLINPIMLCGTMFGLRIFRHRLFESNVLLFAPKHTPHAQQGLRAPRTGRRPKVGEVYSPYGHFSGVAEARAAMGIDWYMTQGEVAQAIPPAYSRYIAGQLCPSNLDAT
jgi:DNA (cytosine-5)-methyltransferase 1